MSDYSGWPTGYAAADAGVRSLAFLMATVVGLTVAFGPLGRVGEQTGRFGIAALAWLVILAAITALVATIFRQWKVELVAVYVLTAIMLVYTVADWWVLLFVVGYPPVPLAALAIGGGAAAVAAVATGKKRWRWAALAGSAMVIALAVPLDARNTAFVTLATSLLASRAIGLTVFRKATVEAQEGWISDGWPDP